MGLLGALSLRDQATVTTLDTNSQVQRIKWRTPVAFGTQLPALGDNIVFVAEALKTASNGRFLLEVYEPGMLVPAFSITESVKADKLAAGYTWLGYDQGKIPATPLISAVPFGMEPWEYTAWYYEAGGKALAEARCTQSTISTPYYAALLGQKRLVGFVFRFRLWNSLMA